MEAGRDGEMTSFSGFKGIQYEDRRSSKKEGG